VNLLEQQFFALLRDNAYEKVDLSKYEIYAIIDSLEKFEKSKKINNALVVYHNIDSAKKFLKFMIERGGKSFDWYDYREVGFDDIFIKLGFIDDIEKELFDKGIWCPDNNKENLQIMGFDGTYETLQLPHGHMYTNVQIPKQFAANKNYIDNKPEYCLKLLDLKSHYFTDMDFMYTIKLPKDTTFSDITLENIKAVKALARTDYSEFLKTTKLVMTKYFPQPMIDIIHIHDIKFVEERDSIGHVYKIAVITDESGTQITLADYDVMTTGGCARYSNLDRSAFYEIVAEDLIGTDIFVQMYYMDGKIYGNPLAVITDENIIYFID
jgi:hypothetical protein